MSKVSERDALRRDFEMYDGSFGRRVKFQRRLDRLGNRLRTREAFRVHACHVHDATRYNERTAISK